MPSKPHDITRGFHKLCQGAPTHREAESAASLKLGGDLVHVKWNSKNKKTLSIDIPIIKFRYQVQGAHKQTAIFSRDNETTQINSPHHT